MPATSRAGGCAVSLADASALRPPELRPAEQDSGRAAAAVFSRSPRVIPCFPAVAFDLSIPVPFHVTRVHAAVALVTRLKTSTALLANAAE